MINFDDKFLNEYNNLNDEQKQAVDKIDGPVLVLAGPGTGKTQLLGMRVANILHQTDATPQNILCLTFTEAAATNMTDRMAKIFGPEAYKVSVNTFHGFCANVMNQFSEYFYQGAQLTVANDLEKSEIVSGILRELPYDNPLSGVFNELPTYLKSTQSAISNLKRQAGLTPQKLRELANENLDFINFIESEMSTVFEKPFGRKKTDMDANISQVLPVLQKISTYNHPEYSLAELIVKDFTTAIETAQIEAKTTALTAFRNRYVDHKKKKMSDRARTEKILALADVYEKYNERMFESGLFDFDDMILNVGEMLEKNANFKADLQERYQYILIDEFQDTNDAQTNIIYKLTDYDNPNVMVVGDDDQAIYSFQGANVNNVTKFVKHYNKFGIEKIQLYQNYRSEEKILTLADNVINASQVRIKRNVFENVVNLLVKKKPKDNSEVQFLSGETETDEYSFVAQKVAEKIKNGNDDVAIIAKKHSDLMAILPYLETEGIDNIAYENRQNALESVPVRQLELLARIVTYIGTERNTQANTLLPEILAHPAFNIKPIELWQLSLSVERGKVWLEEMLERGGKLTTIANWLIEMSKKVKSLTLEQALDELFAEYHQPYFFNEAILTANPAIYIEYLIDLQIIRQVVREQQSTQTPTLEQFIETLDLYRRFEIPIGTMRHFGDNAKVHLLTAHKAKGLEFDSVFILNSSDKNWLTHGGGQNNITPPNNLQISANQDDNELWRLLFVSITRAKHQLFLTHHSLDNKGRTIKPLEFEIFKDKINKIQPRQTTLKNPDPAWNAELVKPDLSLKELLSDTLKNYKLNATAVNSFVNLEYAGPQSFLLNNLLRFPSVKSASAEFGSSIHETIKLAHQYFTNHNKKMPISEAQTIFASNLITRHLSNTDHDFYLKKGKNLLETYLNWADFDKNQLVEQKLTARIGEVTLTGNLDLIQVDKKSKKITVFDYKTGSPFDKFDSGTKFKTHGYKQQLIFYKLLIGNSPEYAGYFVEQGVIHFVEPVDDKIKTLNLQYSEEEVETFVELTKIIWQHIQSLNFPDTSKYEKNLRGSLQFEKDLLSDTV